MDGGSGSKDNGVLLTCVYHIPLWTDAWTSSRGGELRLYPQELAGASVSLEPFPDRLVIYRSREIMNEVL